MSRSVIPFGGHRHVAAGALLIAAVCSGSNERPGWFDPVTWDARPTRSRKVFALSSHSVNGEVRNSHRGASPSAQKCVPGGKGKRRQSCLFDRRNVGRERQAGLGRYDIGFEAASTHLHKSLRPDIGSVDHLGRRKVRGAFQARALFNRRPELPFAPKWA